MGCTRWGNAAFFAKDFPRALERFEAAIRANPADHRGYFHKGDALLALGRIPEALDAYAWGLTVRPRAELLRRGLRQHQAELGRTLEGDLYLPPARIQEDHGTIVESFAGKSWLAFANCRALWLGEPEHAQTLIGSGRPGFSSVEELECLADTVALHNVLQDADPKLDKVAAIARSGQAMELIIFELATRVDPHVVLTLSGPAQQRIHDFVLQWILVPNTGGITAQR